MLYFSRMVIMVASCTEEVSSLTKTSISDAVLPKARLEYAPDKWLCFPGLLLRGWVRRGHDMLRGVKSV